MEPVNVPAKFAAVRSFTHSWDNIAIAVLSWGCEPPNLAEGDAVGGPGMVPSERALVSSYRRSIVTFHLSLRVSEIRFCAPARHFPQFSPHL